MKCQECGSEHGFRGEAAVEHRKRSDGQMEMIQGPEIIYCKKCGAVVKPEDGGEVKVLSGVPSHLQHQFDGESLPEGDES